jgi:hypothetical protein
LLLLLVHTLVNQKPCLSESFDNLNQIQLFDNFFLSIGGSLLHSLYLVMNRDISSIFAAKILTTAANSFAQAAAIDEYFETLEIAVG